MVALAVRDLGVDESLGANRRKAAQRGRIRDAAQSAKRIARVPTGWRGRTAMALALSRSQFLWGAEVSGITEGGSPPAPAQVPEGSLPR